MSVFGQKNGWKNKASFLIANHKIFLTVLLVLILSLGYFVLPNAYHLADVFWPPQNKPEVLAQQDQNNNAGINAIVGSDNNQPPDNQKPSLAQFFQMAGNSIQAGDIIIKKDGQLYVAPNAISAPNIKRHSIEAINLDSGSVDSRIIADHSIGSNALKNYITLQHLTVVNKLYADTLDFGTNTISDKVMTGDWNFGSGNLTTTGLISGSFAGAFAPSGDVDMANHIMTNIGHSGTDFNSLGGLTLANALTVSSGGVDVTGDSSISGALDLTGNLTAPNVLYSLSGTAHRITVSAGQNPALDIASDYAGQSSITTLGTITSGIWNGSIVSVPYGGTGINGGTAPDGSLIIGNGFGYTLATLTAGTGVAITNGAGSITVSTNLGVGGTLMQITGGNTFSLKEGTLTTTDLCTYVSGTGLVCNQANNSADWDSGYTYRFTGVTNNATGLTLSLGSNNLTAAITSGYVIPTTTEETNWNTAYTNRITGASSPLSIASNALSISQASGSANGYLSSTDWNTFNGKQNALTMGNLSSSTSGVSITGGTGAVIGAGVTIAIVNADGTHTGLLTSTDWGTFNSKENALTFSGPLARNGNAISISQADGSTNGYLSSTDWNTFNGKQPAGSYLTTSTNFGGDLSGTYSGLTIGTGAITAAKLVAALSLGSGQTLSFGSGTLTANALNSGTYGISISGNAATATSATNATNATTATNISGSLPLSQLGSPTQNTSLAMGNYLMTLTFGSATGLNNLFSLSDTASNTGLGYLMNIATASGSLLNPLHISASGAEGLTVNSSGLVGIGTSSPHSQLTVADGATFGVLYASQLMGDGNVAISGNLGIGTTSPGAALEVNGNMIVDGTGQFSQVNIGTTNLTAASFGGSPFSNGQSRGSELAPAFASSPNYTVVNHGSTIAEAAGTMTVTGSSSGVNTFTPTTAITPVANYLYRVKVTLTTFSAGSFTVSMGGVTEPTVNYNTTSGAGVYEFFILASNTNNLLITFGASGTQTLTFTSVSVEQVGSYPNPQYVFASNAAETTAKTIYAPASATGMDFMVEVTAAYAVYVKPRSADSIYVGTTAYSNNLALAAVRQTYVLLRCNVVNNWDELGVNGSVTPS